MSASALLLAAGQSRRMGRLKALLPWQGTSLLQFQMAQLLDGGASEVVVVLGHAADELHPLVVAVPRVRPLHNPDYASGRASSLRRGVAALDPEAQAVIVLGVDQPRPASLIRRLLAEHQTHAALITVPVHRGRRGHPVIFAQALFPELARVSEEGLGLREVMARHSSEVVEVDIDEPVVLLDLNTPADYQPGLRFFSPDV